MKPLELLLLECSPRHDNSTSRHLSRQLLPAIGARLGREVRLIERQLGAHPLPPICAEYAEALLLPVPEAKARYGEALALSDALIAELDRADLLVIASPVHNFTAPAALKTWIDYVVRRDVTFKTTPNGKVGLLRDRPTLVAVTAGGAMFRDPPLQPDFFMPYLRAILGVIGLNNVSFARSAQLASAASPFEVVNGNAREWLASGLEGLAAQSA